MMDDSRPSKFRGKAISYALAALVVPALQGVASAQQGDLAEGEKLYVSQCMICHGKVTTSATSERAPKPPQRQLLRLAMQQGAAGARTDVSAPMTAGSDTAAGSHATPRAADAAAPGPLAFAPPFGPHLRGVYGRPAGSVEGFDYSSTFMKTLKGMEWNDAALDVWITNPQAWVPGVYMFYKQPDPEIRRKIILYLKANS
jgi:cytochrome c